MFLHKHGVGYYTSYFRDFVEKRRALSGDYLDIENKSQELIHHLRNSTDRLRKEGNELEHMNQLLKKYDEFEHDSLGHSIHRTFEIYEGEKNIVALFDREFSKLISELEEVKHIAKHSHSFNHDNRSDEELLNKIKDVVSRLWRIHQFSEQSASRIKEAEKNINLTAEQFKIKRKQYKKAIEILEEGRKEDHVFRQNMMSWI